MQKLTIEQQRMVEDNLALVSWLLNNKVQYVESSEHDDLYQIGAIGLCKAVMTFRTGLGFQFATYASRCILNEIYMYMRGKRSRRKLRGEVSLDQPVDSELGDGVVSDFVAGLESTESDLGVMLLEDAVSNLRGLKNKVLTMYLDGYTQIEIAEAADVSQSYVSRVLKKARNDVRYAYEADESAAVS